MLCNEIWSRAHEIDCTRMSVSQLLGLFTVWVGTYCYVGNVLYLCLWECLYAYGLAGRYTVCVTVIVLRTCPWCEGYRACSLRDVLESLLVYIYSHSLQSLCWTIAQTMLSVEVIFWTSSVGEQCFTRVQAVESSRRGPTNRHSTASGHNSGPFPIHGCEISLQIPTVQHCKKGLWPIIFRFQYIYEHLLTTHINPLASEKIRTDSRIKEIQALTPFN